MHVILISSPRHHACIYAPFLLAHNAEFRVGEVEEENLLARQPLAQPGRKSAREKQQFQNAATAAWLPYSDDWHRTARGGPTSIQEYSVEYPLFWLYV